MCGSHSLLPPSPSFPLFPSTTPTAPEVGHGFLNSAFSLDVVNNAILLAATRKLLQR